MKIRVQLQNRMNIKTPQNVEETEVEFGYSVYLIQIKLEVQKY